MAILAIIQIVIWFRREIKELTQNTAPLFAKLENSILEIKQNLIKADEEAEELEQKMEETVWEKVLILFFYWSKRENCAENVITY